MDVKNNDYTSKETSLKGREIYENINIFNPNKIVIAPENISLKEYLIGANIGLDLPDTGGILLLQRQLSHSYWLTQL